MGLRVNTNIFSLNAQRNLGQVSQRLGGNYARLSSGLRIASAADDAAGLGISERMRSQIRGLGQAARNTQDGLSVAQTAEGAVQEVSNNLSRMRELAVQASSGTLSTEDRAIIDEEFQALDEEINRIATETEFNGQTLLDGSNSFAIQVGLDAGQEISIAAVDVQSASLGIDSLDVSTDSGAEAALTALDTAINSVNTSRGSLGSIQNRLSSAYNSIQATREGLSQAESRIRDVDVAFETADLTRNAILQQAAVSILSQANVQPQLALSLLG
jgi:flagellin